MAEGLLNVDELIAPIAADGPSGTDMRADLSANSPYRTVKGLREANRTAERKRAQGDDVEAPDWSGVLDGATTLLQSTSKDLEVACWAVEALVRLDDFAGLAIGFDLLENLVAKFWDDLYPRPEDGDASYRTMPIANLNGVDQSEGLLIAPISRVMLTQGRAVGPYARWHYKQVLSLETRTPETRQRMINEGAASAERLQQAAAETDAGFFQSRHADIKTAIARFDALTTTLSAKCGPADAPPSSAIRGALEECLQVVTSLAGPKLSAAPVAQAATNGSKMTNNGTGGASTDGTPRVGFAPPQTGVDREQIFATIQACAAAWQKLEPQSLLPATLERVVRWGKMPVDELMRELITEDGALSSLSRLTGVKYYVKPDS